MCCLVTTLILLGPRAAIVIWWLAASARWDAAFTTFWWPLMGFLFFPWTTLMFVVVAPRGTVRGFDWFWLGLAALTDLGSYTGGAYGRRRYNA
jgi:hypothetical protein